MFVLPERESTLLPHVLRLWHLPTHWVRVPVCVLHHRVRIRIGGRCVRAPSTLTFTATTTTITLPAQTVVPTCPSCLDIAYTGSLAYPYDGEGPGVRVGVTLVIVNGLTPSVVFGPATAAAPQVALVPNTFVPVGVRYVTCQPRGTFTVAVQFTLLSDAPVGEDTITLAFNGLLTIVGKKC